MKQSRILFAQFFTGLCVALSVVFASLQYNAEKPFLLICVIFPSLIAIVFSALLVAGLNAIMELFGKQKPKIKRK